jgi:hypothetical protein
MRRHATAWLLGIPVRDNELHSTTLSRLRRMHTRGVCTSQMERVRRAADVWWGLVNEATLNTCMRCTCYTLPAAVGFAAANCEMKYD